VASAVSSANYMHVPLLQADNDASISLLKYLQADAAIPASN